MRRAPFALLVSLALLVPAPANAEDPPAKSDALVLAAELDAAKAAKDDAKWVEAAKRVGDVYAKATDADKKVLIGAAGNGLKSKAESVQNAAIDALLATKDGDAAWKAGLKSELPDEKAETAKATQVRVLVVLKDLHPDAAIQPLLNLFAKAKDPKVNAAAMKALGGYERSSKRAMVLEELVKSIRGAMPSRSATKASAPTPRWVEIEPHVVDTLNELTGQKISDLGTWLKFIDEDGKKNPKVLFKNDL